MRSDIWGLLGISPTGDRKAIRSAYAAQSRLHHPEEEPEYFVELNQAYKQALDFARTAGAGDADVNSREDGTGRENKGSAGNRGDREDRNSADGRRVERNRKGEEDRNGRYREGAGDTGDRDDQEDKGSSESVKSYDTESGD